MLGDILAILGLISAGVLGAMLFRSFLRAFRPRRWTREESKQKIIDWAEKNGLSYRAYPCGHVACSSLDVEFPDECPFTSSHRTRS